MRACILVFLFFSPLSLVSAQQDEESAIRERIQQFIDLSNAGDWAAAFDLLYPKLFTYVRRDELVTMMKELADDGMQLQMEKMRIRTLSLPMQEEGNTYVRVGYAAEMQVRIRSDGKYGSPASLETLTAQFTKAYGAENVDWIPAEQKFAIQADKAMIAVKTPGNPTWYLVEINPDQPDLMAFLFPPAVLDKLVNPD